MIWPKELLHQWRPLSVQDTRSWITWWSLLRGERCVSGPIWLWIIIWNYTKVNILIPFIYGTTLKLFSTAIISQHLRGTGIYCKCLARGLDPRSYPCQQWQGSAAKRSGRSQRGPKRMKEVPTKPCRKDSVDLWSKKYGKGRVFWVRYVSKLGAQQQIPLISQRESFQGNFGPEKLLDTPKCTKRGWSSQPFDEMRLNWLQVFLKPKLSQSGFCNTCDTASSFADSYLIYFFLCNPWTWDSFKLKK